MINLLKPNIINSCINKAFGDCYSFPCFGKPSSDGQQKLDFRSGEGFFIIFLRYIS